MTSCACRADEPYDCWAARYPESLEGTPHISGRESIQQDGGPCSCPCHDYVAEDSEE